MKSGASAGLLLSVLTIVSAQAEGRIDFFNRNSNNTIIGDWIIYGWPIYTSEGPASGSRYLAQLLAGTSPDRLVPVGPPVQFRVKAGEGYFDRAKDPSGLVRVVPTVDDIDGGTTFVHVVVWSAWYGIRSYEEFREYMGCGGYVEYGRSPVVEMKTSPMDRSEPPAVMDNVPFFFMNRPLMGWDDFYVPRPTNALLRVQFVANLNGAPGRHTLEWSTNLVNWHAGPTYTNEFMLDLVLTNDVPARFYRMQRHCD